MTFLQALAAAALSLTIGLSSLPTPAAAAERYMTLGTGGAPGVYYAAGAAICRSVAAERAELGIACHVGASGGSIDNLRSLRRGEIEFGIVQSDWQLFAYRGTDRFAGEEPFADLRAVFSLHTEPFTVVARADSGIARFADLKGRRVNIGNPGSGQRATTERVLDALGWTTADFSLAAELKSSEQSRALCRGDIDAMVFVAGHPNDSVRDAAEGCDVVLVDVVGPIIDRLVAEHRVYRSVAIPGGLYRGIPDQTKTFGVRATLVSTTRVPADMVYAVVKTVFDDLAAFKGRHPALATLRPKAMATEGLSAPLHEGAKRFFVEANLQ
jgi:TRAP transporter TAXI family solute receptor